MEKNSLFLIVFTLSILLLIKTSFGITITAKDSYFEVNSSNYRAFVSYNGTIIDFYIKDSPYSSLGYKILGYPGIFLTYNYSKDFIIPGRNSSGTNYIKFENQTFGNWTYYFYDDSIIVTVNVSGNAENGLNFYFLPDIDYVTKVRNINGEEIYLKDWFTFTNISWNNVTFYTLENVSFNLFLLESSSSQTFGYLEELLNGLLQVWAIDNLNGPYNMRNGNYSIKISINASNFTPLEKIDIKQNGEVVKVNASVYSLNITNGYIAMLNFFDSVLNNFGDRLNNVPSICFSTDLQNCENSMLLGIDKNKIYFNNSLAYFYYTLFNKSLYLNIKPHTASQFFISPSIDAIKEICNLDNTSECIDLSGGIGSDKEWTNVSYRTIENVLLNMKVLRKGDTTGTKAITSYFRNNQIWGFLEKLGPYQLYENSKTKIEIGFNTSNFTRYDENLVNITVGVDEINVTTSNYTVFLSKNGTILSFYVKNSFMNLMGKADPENKDGLILRDSQTNQNIKAASFDLEGFKIGFYSPGIKWFYRFYPERIQIISTIESPSNSTYLLLVPMIESMKNMKNNLNRSEVYDLFSEVGRNIEKTITSVAFESLEGSELIFTFLNSTDPNAKTQTAWMPEEHIQVWGLEDFSSGAGTSMVPNNTYSVQIDLNLTEYTPLLTALKITEYQDYYNVSAGQYWRVIVYKNGTLGSLKIGKAEEELMFDGIYLSTNSSGRIPLLQADSSLVLGNRIYFFSSLAQWRFEFYEKRIYVVPKLSNYSDLSFWFGPKIESFISLCNVTGNECIDLSAHYCENNESYNKDWFDVVYQTNNNDFLRIYLYGAPVFVNGLSSKGSIGCYYNDTVYWSLSDLFSPDAMRKTGVYKIILDLKPRISEVEQINYPYDGKTGKAYLFFPENYTLQKSLPLLVCLHGFQENATECLTSNLLNESNSRNWLLLAVQGYGRVENESYYNGSALGWIDFQKSVLGAIDYVKSNYKVNTSKIYLLALDSTSLIIPAKYPEYFAAAVGVYSISNLTKWKEELDSKNDISRINIVEEEIGGNYSQYLFEYNRRSPIYYSSNLRYLPLLLMRNESDEIVNYTQSDELYEKLKDFGNVFLRNLSFSLHNSSLLNATEIFDFLDQYSLNLSPKNISFVYDENGEIDWIKFWIKNFNQFGPDLNDSQDSFCRIDANFSSNYIELASQNIERLGLNLARLDIAENLTFIFSSAASYIFNWNNRQMNVSCNTGGNIKIENYVPTSINCQNFTVSFSYSISQPYINESNYPLVNSIWNITSKVFNFTLNVSNTQGRFLLIIPNNIYNLGFYEVMENDVRIYVGNASSLTLTPNETGLVNYTVRYETIPPTIIFTNPTPSNNTQVNVSWIFVNVTINETSQIDKCIINFQSSQIVMNKNNYVCYYNLTDLNDAKWYNFSVFANDTFGNWNVSEIVYVYVDYNNPPDKPTLISPLNNSYISSRNVSLEYNSSDSDNDSLTFYVSVNGQMYETTKNYYNLTNLEDGQYQWYVIASDSQLNSTKSETWIFYIDTIPPIINILSPQNKTYNTSSIYLYITTNEAASCNYSVNQNNNATINDFNSTVKNATITLEEGFYNITFYCSDLAGNVNASNVAIAIDLFPPFIIVELPLNNSVIPQQSINLNAYINESIKLKNVSFFTNKTGSLTRVYTNSSGLTGSYSYAENYGEGIYQWYVEACDEVRCSQNATYIFVVDLYSPLINISSPKNSSYYNSSSIEVNYSVKDISLDSCWYEIDSNNYTLDSCKNFTLTLNDGYHNLTIYANDSVGRTNYSRVMFIVDTVKPVVEIISPKNSSSYGNSTIPLEFVASDINLDGCWYYLNSNYYELKNCENTTLTLDTGNYNLTICVSDRATNINCNSSFFNVILNFPEITLISPQNEKFYNNKTVEVKYSVKDIDGDLDQCWYSLDDNQNVTLLNCSNATLDLNDGKHTIKIYANDSMNHISFVSANFTIDTINPYLTLEKPENVTYNKTEVSLEFVASDINLDRCWYYLNSNYYELKNCGNTTLNNLATGIYNLTLYVSDLAGNLNFTSIMFSIDVTPPEIQILSPFKDILNSSYVWFNITSNEPLKECSISVNSTQYSMSKENQTYCYILLNLSEGYYSTSIRALDLSFNERTIEKNVSVDVSEPKIYIISPKENTSAVSYVNFTIETDEVCDFCKIYFENFSADMNSLDGILWNYEAYLENKTYSFKIVCKDKAGNFNSTQINIIVYQQLKILSFISDSNFGYTNLTEINFSFVLLSTFPIKSAYFLFGNCSNSLNIENRIYNYETINFSHIFNSSGYYIVKVKVTDEKNNTEFSRPLYIRIYDGNKTIGLNVLEPIVLKIKRIEDGEILSGFELLVENSTQINVPNETLKFQISELKNKFIVELKNDNNLTVKLRHIQEDRIHNFDLDLAYDLRYSPILSYALEIPEKEGENVKIIFNTTIENPKIFKIGYDFATDTINYTKVEMLEAYKEGNTLYTYTSCCSLFVLANDTGKATQLPTSVSSVSSQVSIGYVNITTNVTQKEEEKKNETRKKVSEYIFSAAYPFSQNIVLEVGDSLIIYWDNKTYRLVLESLNPARFIFDSEKIESNGTILLDFDKDGIPEASIIPIRQTNTSLEIIFRYTQRVTISVPKKEKLEEKFYLPLIVAVVIVIVLILAKIKIHKKEDIIGRRLKKLDEILKKLKGGEDTRRGGS